MTKNFDELNDAFNVSADVVTTEPTEVGITKPEKHERTDIERDYDYTRGNLYSIIEKGQAAIDGILELAQESEIPRATKAYGDTVTTNLSENIDDSVGIINVTSASGIEATN